MKLRRSRYQQALKKATHPPRRRRPTASESTAGPIRTCIGCRRAAGVEELVRIRATASGLELGAGPGRGAWLCRNHSAACLEEAMRRRTVERALRTSIGNDDIEGLRARLFACESPGDQQVIDR